MRSVRYGNISLAKRFYGNCENGETHHGRHNDFKTFEENNSLQRHWDQCEGDHI